ncbi:MAG: hypothetical protein QXE80_03575 [Pyrobaculum sp.]
MTVTSQHELLQALAQQTPKIYISLANDIELQPDESFFNYLFALETQPQEKELLWYGNFCKLVFPDTVFYALLGMKISGEIHDTEFVFRGTTNYALAFHAENLKISNCRFTGRFSSNAENAALVSWVATGSKMVDCKFQLSVSATRVALLSVIADDVSQLVNCTSNLSPGNAIVTEFIKRM